MENSRHSVPVEHNDRHTDQSELERQAFVLETITDGSFRLNVQGIILHASPGALQKIFDLRSGEIVGKNFWQEFPRFSGSIFQKKVRQAFSSHQPTHFEAHISQGDKWYEVYVFPEAGQVDLYLKDITHRKHFELKAYRQDSELKAVFDSDPGGLAVVTRPDFLLVYANRAYLDLLPEMSSDPIGKPVLDLIPSGSMIGLEINLFIKQLQDQQDIFIPQLIKQNASGVDQYFAVHLRNLEWEEQPAVLIAIWETTEREQALKELHATRLRNEEILESIADGLFGLDQEWCFTYINPNAAHNVGFSPDQLIGKNIWEVFPQILGTDHEKYYRQVMEQRQPANFEIDGVLGDQSYDIRVYPSQAGITVYWVDITQRRRTEESLRLNEERLREIMENSQDLVYRRNLQTDCYDYISPVSEQVLGYTPDEMNHLPIDAVLDQIHPDDRAEVESGMLRALETGRARILYRFKRKDGVYRWIADNITIQYDTRGQPLYRSGILRDITERKLAEDALKESEDRFRLAAQAMNEGLWELNFETNQSWWNEAYNNLFGPRPIQRSDDVYDWWLDHVYPDDREDAKRTFWEAIEGDADRWECEYRFQRPDGATTYVLDRAVIARNPEGKAIRITGAMMDLTNLKQAEVEREKLMHELEAERSLWKATVSSMVDAVTICDAEGQAYYMNEAYTRLVEKTIVPGLSMEDTPEAYQLYHPDGSLFEPAELPLQKAALSGETQRGVELVQKTAAGQELLFTWNASPIRDEHGAVIGAVAVGHEITQQRKMEKTLRESEEKFRLIADTMPSLVWTAEPDGTIDYLNKHSLELLGHITGQTLQDTIIARLPQEERRAITQAWQASVEQGQPFDLEFRLNHPDGALRWYISRSIPVRNQQGTIVKWYGTATDIQDLKLAQQELERRVQMRTKELHVANEELRQSAGRSLALSEISRQMSLAGVDYQRVVDAVVKTTSRLIGDAAVLRLLSEDGRWLNPVSFFHKDADVLAAMARVLKPDTCRPDEGIQGEVIQSAKGKIIVANHKDEWLAFAEEEALLDPLKFDPSSALIVPLRMRDKVVGTLMVTRDRYGYQYNQEDQILLQELADRAALAIFNSMLYRDLEKSLLQEKLMRQQLIQSEKYAALARLVASVAHELNNPIQTIQNCIFLARQESPAGPSQDFLNMAIEETRRIARLTEQLRETYRPSKDNTFKSIDLVEVLKDVHNLLEPHFQHHLVSWEMRPSPAKVMVHGIPDQLKQVFINICINGIDAIGDNGGRLVVGVLLYPERQRACVSFQDSGPGIPPENLGKLFEPFFTTKSKGTGLGLSICREIVEGHGGEITVDSRQGQGAIFKVWLPILEVNK